MVTFDDLLSTAGELPPSGRPDLQWDVRRRVVRRRRRRRALRLSASAVALVAVLATAVGPQFKAGVDTTGRESTPADDGGVDDVPAGRPEEGALAPAPGGAAAGPVGPDGALGTPAPARGTPPAGDVAAGGDVAAAEAAVAKPSSVRVVFARRSQFYEMRLDGSGLRRLPGEGSEPAASPDGTTIAYVGHVVGGQTVLRTVDVRTGETRQLTELADDGVGRPAWSPDGAWLVFTQGSTVRVLEPATGASRVIGEGATPAWTPDGRIGFWCREGICLAWRDGSAAGVVPGSADIIGAAWSPDGAWFAGVKGADLVLMRADGSGRRTLLTGRASPKIAWFPDGSRIAFRLNPSGNYDDTSCAERPCPGERGLWSIRPDGSDPRPLTDDAFDESPSFVVGP